MDTIVSHQHTALFYESEEEYLDIAVPFLKSGLENNEFVLWVLPEFMKVEDANIHLHKSLENLDYFVKRGQISIQDYKAVYMKEGVFSLTGMIDSIAELEKKALQKGFNGICAIGDGSWALEDCYWWNFLTYEAELNSITENCKMRALCTYFKKNIDIKKIFEIGKNHQEVVVNQRGGWSRLAPGDFENNFNL